MQGFSFYNKMAKTNLKNNRQIYVPYILIGTVMVAVLYIMLYLATDSITASLRGGDSVRIILRLGCLIVGPLSVVLLFYTNSFLMKRRKKEFGLYNVLGMEKRHICRVMLIEIVYCSLFSIVVGLVAGIGFYKLSLLVLTKLINADIRYGFSVSVFSLIVTLAVFIGIFFLSYLWNCFQIWRMDTIELLKSDRTGEKEPKVKWITFLLGLVCTGTGYYISLTTESPLQALTLFFGAVALVIIGTYFLFVSGSIALLKALKNSKRYYYHPKHMTAVSGLLYRMKQNAVGLASICILFTAVLVMVSTTVSLYAGVTENVNAMTPYDLMLEDGSSRDFVEQEKAQKKLYESVKKEAKNQGLTITEERLRIYFSGGVIADKTGVTSNIPDSVMSSINMVEECQMIFAIEEKEYKKLTGEGITLGEQEVAIYEPKQNRRHFEKEICLNGEIYQIKEVLKDFPIEETEYKLFNCHYLVFRDFDAMRQFAENYMSKSPKNHGMTANCMSSPVMVNFKEKGKEAKKRITNIVKAISTTNADEKNGSVLNYQYRFETEDYYFGMVGGLFFLGITLGGVFLLTMVLLIYYKQISEGYEDRKRFQIMLKVGMSKKEVKSSIRSQILQVFFLPIVVAIVHVAVVFPMIVKLMGILSVAKTSVYFISTCVTVIVFVIIYTFVYNITAKVYYDISVK